MRMLYLDLPQKVQLQATEYRKKLYRKSGDTSTFWGPKGVCLGPWEKQRIPRSVAYPKGKVLLGETSRTAQGFTVAVKGLEKTLESLGLKTKPFLFLCRESALEEPFPVLAIDDFRITLYEIEKQDFLLSWRAIDSLHLWKGKGPRQDSWRTGGALHGRSPSPKGSPSSRNDSASL